MILYLSGPITGHTDYREKFAEAQGRLKGHIILNPAILPTGLRLYENYMQISYSMLMAADGIVMLPGWKKSFGARQELKWAMQHGKEVYFGPDSVQERMIRKRGVGFLTGINNHRRSDDGRQDEN